MSLFTFFISLVLAQVAFSQQITLELEKTAPKKTSAKTHLKHYSIDVEKKLKNQHDNSYLVNLQFGSNKKTFSLTVDTGSADLFIPSIKNEECRKKSAHHQNKIPLYDCEESTTCTKTDEMYNLFYGDGGVYTVKNFDTVYLTSSVFVENQSFLVSRLTSGNFDCHGILGLGFPALARNEDASLINNLITNGVIKKNIFSLYLTSNNKKGSRLVIGGYENEYFKDPNATIVFFPIVSSITFRIRVDFIEYGDKKFKLQNALVDSGTSLITLSKKLGEDLIETFKNDHNIRCRFEVEREAPSYSEISCFVNTKSNKLPQISFIVDSHKLIMEPEDYVSECKILNNEESYCGLRLEIDSNNYDSGSIILGDTLLHSYYSVFDLDDKKIGLVKNKNVNKISVHKSNGISPFDIPNTDNDSFSWKEGVLVGVLCAVPLIGGVLYWLFHKKIIGNERLYLLSGGAFVIFMIFINVWIMAVIQK